MEVTVTTEMKYEMEWSAVGLLKSDFFVVLNFLELAQNPFISETHLFRSLE